MISEQILEKNSSENKDEDFKLKRKKPSELYDDVDVDSGNLISTGITAEACNKTKNMRLVNFHVGQPLACDEKKYDRYMIQL